MQESFLTHIEQSVNQEIWNTFPVDLAVPLPAARLSCGAIVLAFASSLSHLLSPRDHAAILLSDLQWPPPHSEQLPVSQHGPHDSQI